MLSLPLLRRGASVLAVALAFYACQDGSGAPTVPGSETGSAPSEAEPMPIFSRLPNPVLPGDFADPFVLVDGAAYYAYATNRSGRNVPVLRSADLVTWTPAGDALPELPAWAVSGKKLTWAPAVLASEEQGRYLLFFTARDRRSNRQCIGRAESSAPTGPFVDSGLGPLICQADLGGSIDASVLRDSAGQIYILWKNDGNCCGKPVSLWAQRLRSDGRALVGHPSQLLTRDQSWEGSLIEAPTMWAEHGAWHLLYSANMWDTPQYAVGYARCESPLGPCRKIGTWPVMASDGETAGPGGMEVFSDRQGLRWVAYHGWSTDAVGYSLGGARSLRLDRVELRVVTSQLLARPSRHP